MGRSRNNESSEIKKKSQLVMDICNISIRANSCAHNNKPERSHFVDWYLVLGIEESADVDVIKKRYRRLALQLHPDKNKHPKAEIAFKLVSDAYVCLSDNTLRVAFDVQRQNNFFCKECFRNSYPPKMVKSSNVWQILKGLKAKFFQEALVIETCMKINGNGMKEPRTCNARSRGEYPIFNPSDYVFHGYPHHRNQRRVYSVNKKNQSPIFEHRTESAQKCSRNNKQSENLRNDNDREVERFHHPTQEGPTSPETWRKPVDEHLKQISNDTPIVRNGKIPSAIELATAFSKSVSDPVGDYFSGQRNLTNRNQTPLSRLMGPPQGSQAQINSY